MWNDAAMLKMTLPFWTAITLRLEYEPPSRSRLTVSRTRREASPRLRK